VGDGEQLIESFHARGVRLADARRGPRDRRRGRSPEYWKCFADPERRRGQLELYRSGDFEKLRPYDGKLAALGVPTLLLWARTTRSRRSGARHRFHKQIPGSQLAVIGTAGTSSGKDAPGRSAAEVLRVPQPVKLSSSSATFCGRSICGQWPQPASSSTRA